METLKQLKQALKQEIVKKLNFKQKKRIYLNS